MKSFFAASFALLTPVVLAAHQQQHRSHTNVAAMIKRSQPEVRAELTAEACAEAVTNLGEYTVYEPACVNLIYSCLDTLNETTAVWSQASCVAAATCDGTRNLLALAQCENSAISADVTDDSFLNYNVYAAIVGDCAWEEDACPITQQNYVDFFYSTLEKLGSKEWPVDADSVVTNYWEPIKEWAQTGETIPYRNFADWLLYSDSYAVEEESTDCEA